MTEHETAIDERYSPNERAFGRYGSFATNGDVLVYDRENAERWIQSDVAVELEEMH